MVELGIRGDLKEVLLEVEALVGGDLERLDDVPAQVPDGPADRGE
jgi:hypothetical protein